MNGICIETKAFTDGKVPHEINNWETIDCWQKIFSCIWMQPKSKPFEKLGCNYGYPFCWALD